MTIEVPSAYTVVGSHIATNSTRFTYTGVSRTSDEYASYDFGAGYFSGSAYLEGTFQITAGSGVSPKSVSIGFTDTLNDWSATTNQCGDVHRLAGDNTTLNAYAALRESGASLDVQSATNLAINTVYYMRTGFFSSLSRYGTVLTQTFSDSGMTTLVDSVKKDRAAAATYQYVIAGQSYTTGSAQTITGYDENITVFRPAAGDNLNAMSGSHASIATYAANTNVIACTSFASDVTTAQKYNDAGVGYYSGDYVQLFDLNHSSGTINAYGYLVAVLTNSTGDQNSSTVHSRACHVVYGSPTTATLKLREKNGTTETESASTLTHTFGRPAWGKKWYAAADGKEYLALYSDPARLNIIGSAISLTVSETPSFRYSMPVSSYGTSGSTNVGSFTLGGYSATLVPTVTGTAAWTEDDDTVAVAGAFIKADAAFTEADDTVSVAGANDGIADVAFTEADDSVSIAGSSGAPSATVLVNEDDDTVAATVAISNAATVVFTEDSDAVAVAGSFTATIIENFGFQCFNNNGDKFTGQTGYIEAYNSSRQQYDWVSKAFATPAGYKLTLTEADAVNDTGFVSANGDATIFDGEISFRGWFVSTEDSATKNYPTTAMYSNGTRLNLSNISITVSAGNVADIAAANRVEMDSNSTKLANLDAPISGVASAVAAAIDAALMSNGLTYAQSKIVNDAILHGKVTGADTATESCWSVNQANVLVERVRFTSDASGNRTNVVFINVDP